MLLLAWIACVEPAPEDSSSEVEADADTDSDSDSDTDSDADTDPHEVGRVLPPFALVDLNPSSSTYEQVVDSEQLLGSSFALVFLDSRCLACKDVTADLWAQYEANPGWWELLPTYAIESMGGAAVPEGIEPMVEGNDMPYLADTEEVLLWQGYKALNHDFYVVSAEGTLEAWLPLYTWPEDLEQFTTYMSLRFPD